MAPNEAGRTGQATDEPNLPGAAVASEVSGTALIAPGAEDGRTVPSAQRLLPVQVCYAAPTEQTVIDLMVPPGTTLAQAIRLSGMVACHGDIDLSTQKVGVFGKVKALDDVVLAHDRVEIYRPLIVDPKVARARRVAKTRKGGSIEGRKWVTREAR